MLNRCCESGQPILFQNLAGRLLAFHCRVLCWLWVCHKWLLLCWDVFPLYPLWWEFLSWMDVKFYQMLFLHLLRWSYGFCLSFCWCGWYHTDLYMLDHPCDSGMNPTWPQCMIFCICCWIQCANILLRIFTSMFIKDIGL